MSFMNREVRRVWAMHPATFGLRSLWAGLRAGLGGAPRPLRILLLSDAAAYTSEQQFAPFARHAALLQRRFGAVFQYRPIPEGRLDPPLEPGRFDIVGLKLCFSMPAEQALALARHLRQSAGPQARLVYFDGDDDACVQWPEVLALMDAYVKKHVFRDRSTYGRVFRGKNNLTDHAVRQHGYSFEQDIIPQSSVVPPADRPRLHLGWNVGLDDKIAGLAQRIAAMPQPPRDIDLSCRGWVAPEMWTHPFRHMALQAMEAMAPQRSVLAPRDRVSQEVYYQEMLRSRVCVSPFGFGEICWRDFEAILCGCLLVKPDMSHLETRPDVFEAGVTYVPVRWDYADLEAQCRRYLDDEPARLAMVQRAQQRLRQALEPAWFADRFGELLAAVGLGPEGSAAHEAPPGLVKRARGVARAAVEAARRQSMLARIHHVHGPHPRRFGEGLCAVALVRNGEDHVDEFVAHYRGLGVRHFCFIDNDSSDSTAERMRRHADVTIFRTGLKFSRCEAEIRRHVLTRYFQGRWVFCVDIDEHFDYPGRARLDTAGLIAYLDAHGYNAMTACMLDMVPAHEAPGLAGQPFRTEYPLFDLDGIRQDPYPRNWLTRHNRVPPGLVEFHGGIRSRMSDSGHRFVLLKHPLLKIGGDLVPYSHPHYCAHARLADVSGVLLHYKFIRNFLERAEALSRDPETDPTWAKENRIVAAFFGQGDGLRSLALQPYTDCDALVDQGLLQASAAYRGWRSTQRAGTPTAVA